MNFPSTHWTLLAEASTNDGLVGRKALEELCGRYWIPVYQFVRTRARSDVEAQDLTQEFMLHLLQKDAFSRADRLRGRFRSFLLGALVRFLSDQADRRAAQKRGGEYLHVELDHSTFGEDTPEKIATASDLFIFDREWAITLLESALQRVREEYAAVGQQRAFELLARFLPGAHEPPAYETAAAALGFSISALKSEVHRLRRRFRALVRDEVAQTVSAPHEIDEEMEYLRQMLMNRSFEMSSRE